MLSYFAIVSSKGGGKKSKVVTQQTTDRVPGHGPHWEAGDIKPKDNLDPLGRFRLKNDKKKIDYKI